MLEKIKIEGYKSIRNLELELKPINILIGANGVGKSNFISFFKLVNNIYEKRLKNYSLKVGVDNILHYGRKNSDELKGFLSFGDADSYRFILEPSEQEYLFFKEEITYKNNVPYINLNFGESCVKDHHDVQHHVDIKKHLSSYKIYHFHDTSVNAPLRSLANIDDNEILKEDGSNLPAFLYLLQQRHSKILTRIENLIKSIIPAFERFELKPRRLDESKIFLEWTETQQPDFYFNAKHFSDGGIRFIALATLLMQPELPKVIIIDEPELGLHPFAINKLAGLMQSAQARGCQIIASTQSVNLINNFDPEDIIAVDKLDNQSVFNRLDSDELKGWLDDYSLGELWQKSVIKGQPL